MQLSSLTTTSQITASSVAIVINNLIPNVTATVIGSSVIITCQQTGSFCNSYALSTTTNTAVAASAKFTGGNDNSSFNLNGISFPQGSTWVQTGQSSNTAISIAQTIDVLGSYVASTPTANSVLIQCAVAGSFCNSTTLTSSTGALTVASAKFTGGQDAAFVSINGTRITVGTDLPVPLASSTTANVATAFAAAINANTTLNQIVTAIGNSNIVFASGSITTSGSTNYPLYSSTGTLAVSSSTMLGGQNSAYKINTPQIAISSHGFATGEQVGFNTAFPVGGLTSGTSYYVIALDANDIELATTSTGSIAGVFITLTSSSTVGPHTFTLSPLLTTGTAVLSWAESDDCVNFSTNSVTSTNVTIGTMTLVSPYPVTTYGWDFGPTNYRCLRLTVTGPTTAGSGGFNTQVAGYGKRYWR